MISMRMVKIAELKAKLSTHIQHVRKGGEILVCERNTPVARIVPCGVEDQGEHERKLIARGILSPPLKRRSPGPWPEPPGRISNQVASRLWQEEREDR
jgi:prevent-host-death family protein